MSTPPREEPAHSDNTTFSALAQTTAGAPRFGARSLKEGEGHG